MGGGTPGEAPCCRLSASGIQYCVPGTPELTWFFEHADHVDIYDNSAAEPKLVATKTAADLTVYGPLIDDLLAALEPAAPGLRAMVEAAGLSAKAAGPGRRRRRRRRRRKRAKVAAGT